MPPSAPLESSPHPFRRLVPVLFLPLLLAGTTVLLWMLIRDQVAESASYRLDTTRIVIPEPPEWVPAEFLQEVLRPSGLEHEVSLLDPNLAERLASAFLAHPWVAEVRQVELVYPRGARIDLVYREPAALVEMPDGLLPVDAFGVLLRTDYFLFGNPGKKEEYLRITGVRSLPLGNVGAPWGDPLVADAAQLAWMLRDVSRKFGLREIVPEQRSPHSSLPPLLRLRSRGGTEFLWGTLEEREVRNEVPTPEEKKRRLQELIRRYGTLDAIPKNQQPIDLSARL